MAALFTQLLSPFARVLSPILHRLPKPPFRGVDRSYTAASRFLQSYGRAGGRLLVVGGTRDSDRVHFLPHFRPVVIDMARRPEVTVRADALRLPFREGAFDAALSQGMLNNTDDPQRVIDEARRVLRVGGALHASAIFLLPHDPQPIDPVHFTAEGWRRMLGEWDVREIGASVGRWGAIYMLTLRALERVTADAHVNYAAWFIVGHLLRPLLWLDRDGGTDAAAGLYAMAVRR